MFIIDGTKNDAILAIQKLGISSKNDAALILEYIYANQQILGDEEYVGSDDASGNENIMGLVLMDSAYYINIKRTTIILVAFLLDIKLTLGLLALAQTLFGISGKTFHVIDEQSGEKCILQQTLRRASKVGTSDVLECYQYKCCNPQFDCKYKHGSEESPLCNCGSENVATIYDALCEKNVFKKDGKFGAYYYQF